ncbi:hypothetical protein DZB54_18170 [Herbaspirillum sp. 3R-3a1]|nr:hypothetical protein DZB54_18170 [Herbaspirillum sp. 3R-3a1]
MAYRMKNLLQIFLRQHGPAANHLVKLNRLLLTALCSLSLAGCSTLTEVKLYDGPPQDPSRIARLYLDPHVAVTDVDDIRTHPTDKSRVLAHSAGKRREYISLAPGLHSLHAHFFVLCLRSEGAFPLQFNAEPGKKYRLKSSVDARLQKWRPEIVEFDGTEVESDFPWMKAMCPPDVTVFILRR